jgi:ATP-dependent DNA ligase
VAKKHSDPYRPGERGWVKVKHRDHWPFGLELEVYARKMERERDTGARMDALVLGAEWAPVGTSGAIDEVAFPVSPTKNAD